MALPPSWSTPSIPHFPRRAPSPQANSQQTPHTLISPSNPSGIIYTTQLTTRISPRLVGDKILLPQQSLEALLSSASAAHAATAASRSRNNNGESWEGWRNEQGGWGSGGRGGAGGGDALLPHPITFKLFNPVNNRYTHGVPREFSAQDGEIVVSPFLAEVLGLLPSSSSLPSDSLLSSSPGASHSHSHSPSPSPSPVELPNLTVTFKALPKGKYVRLRPLESGYDEQDWKALLERELRVGYSTLTVGEVLSVGKATARDGSTTAGGGNYKFLIDKLLPEGTEAVTVVDTDMEVEMQPLSEEQARETLQKRLAKKGASKGKYQIGKAKGGQVAVGELVEGTVRKGEYIDYKLDKWDRGKGVAVLLVIGESAGGDEEVGGEVDLLVATSRYRGVRDGTQSGAGPREDEFVWGELGSQSIKRVVIGKGNVELLPLSEEQAEGSGEGSDGVEWLSIAVHGYLPPGSTPEKTETYFRLRVSQDEDDLDMSTTDDVDSSILPVAGPNEKVCANCHQAIPAPTYTLHTAFCHRNNIVCNFTPSCGAIFRRGTDIRARHWHCPEPECTTRGNDAHHGGLEKHIQLLHTPRICSAIVNDTPCGHSTANTPGLAQHKTTECPARLILCRFCHLLVPQEGFDVRDQERYTQHLLTGLSSHELTCGSRTTDCEVCLRRIKLLDFATHMRHHDLERLSRPKPVTCANLNCSRVIPLSGTGNELGLCPICFGPLYAPGVYDPTGQNLKRRIERKILTQGVSGCGKSWCSNLWCKSGRANLGLEPFQGGMAAVRKEIVAPLLESWSAAGTSGKGNVRFCVDEQTQKRRSLAEGVAGQEGYDVEWGCKAVEEIGNGGGEGGSVEGDVEGVKRWLGKWGVRRGERLE